MANGIRCLDESNLKSVQRLSYHSIASVTCLNFPTETRAGNGEQKIEERPKRIEEDCRWTRCPE